jgi:hypothetical protein
VDLSIYRQQFPTSQSDEASPLCRQQNKTPTHLDSDFINVVSLAYHDGESHHFALTGLLLESGDINYKSLTQVSNFSDNYQEVTSRASLTEDYRLSSVVIDREQSNYLRSLGYATHFGGEQFLVDSDYSDLLTSGTTLSRITNYSQTLEVLDGDKAVLKSDLELSSKGTSTMSRVNTIDECSPYRLQAGLYTGIAKFRNKLCGSESLLVSSFSSGTETIRLYDTLLTSLSNPIASFSRSANLPWAFIVQNKNIVVFIDNNGKITNLNTTTNTFVTINTTLVFSCVVPYLSCFLAISNSGSVFLIIPNFDTITVTSFLPEVTNCVYALENAQENKHYLFNNNGDILCLLDNSLILLGNSSLTSITSATLYKNYFVIVDTFDLVILDKQTLEVISTQQLPSFNNDSPQFVEVVKGQVIISTTNPSGYSNTYLTLLGDNTLQLNYNNHGYFLFVNEKLVLNVPSDGLFSFEPKLDSNNRTTAITSGCIFHNGQNWRLSFDFDDCLDLRSFRDRSFPIGFFDGFTFNDGSELNKPICDTSYFPDALQQTIDFEPDNIKFKISNSVIPPTTVGAGFLANYPIFCFVWDRRYSGYQEGTTAHPRIQYLLRGTISDTTQGSQPKREIDLPDKNLTEVSVVSDFSALHRVNSVETQISCRWLFGKKPCDYSPSTDSFIISDVGTNDPSESYYIFTVFELDNPNFTFFDSFDGYLLRYGTVEFLSGDNKGFTLPIRRVEVDIFFNRVLSVELLFAAPYKLTIGTQVKLTQGCSKAFSQCINYGQQVNFGGHPYVQGNGIFVRGTNYKN